MPGHDVTPFAERSLRRVERMESARDEAREFLRSRRARLTPDAAGITPFGGNRRVPGLRREEVAKLSGVSVDYYTRLEKGNLRTASDQVLDALSEALQLDEAERTHLFDLARATRGASPAAKTEQRASNPRVPDSLLRILEGMTGIPAMISNGRLDIVAANPLARALYAPIFESPTRLPGAFVNLARFRFLDPASQDFYPRWAESAQTPVGMLRLQASRNPHDKALSNLIGELSTRSEEFRTRWATHDVRSHDAGVKHIRHPIVGDISLDFDAMSVDAHRSLRLMVYTARPNSRDSEALGLLASWATDSAAVGTAPN